jgi:hypothetical protein
MIPETDAGVTADCRGRGQPDPVVLLQLGAAELRLSVEQAGRLARRLSACLGEIYRGQH